jgi:hypothetical protein
MARPRPSRTDRIVASSEVSGMVSLRFICP